ncbi:MAG: hypothetical protein F6K24_58285 [Okeania sp. SIO2D1]|nr:hypothetical protein [Okeania sp. SIO2D1]
MNFKLTLFPAFLQQYLSITATGIANDGKVRGKIQIKITKPELDFTHFGYRRFILA